MLTITNTLSHVTITTELGRVVNLPKNQYEVRQDESDPNHFTICQSDRIEFDFYWVQVTSPTTANPEALMVLLKSYFYLPFMSFEEAVAQGFYPLISIIAKSGRNPNITTASVPEDMISSSSPYTGFPLTAPETLEFFSDNVGDSGVVTFFYLPTATSTAYLSGTVTLNGTTPVNSGITAYRVHTMNYNTGGETSFNLGTITCRWSVTTTVVFQTIAVGTSQSYSAVYTVPFGSDGYVKRTFCEVHDASSVSVQGALWIRQTGQSPRLRRNFAADTRAAYVDEIYGGLDLAPMTDITMRITQCSSASATVVVGGFDLLIIKRT